MSERKSLSEYTWVSAAQYIQWLENNCQLVDVNITEVWSMRVSPKTGFKGLRSRKIRLEAVLKENREKLEIFAQEGKLNLAQVDILSAFVGNIDSAIAILGENIDTLNQIVEREQARLEFEYCDIPEAFGDEPPF